VFIRRKVVRGVTYYAVVENQRPRGESRKGWRTARDGKVKQRTVVSLGRCSTIEAALAEARDWLAFYQERVEWGRKEHRSGRFLHQDLETGRLFFFLGGEAAVNRVAKLERQIAKLEAAQAVVSNVVARGDTI
jgi:hypothetical protein